MPIKVICSRCGGTGKLEFLHCDPPEWLAEPCPECHGAGQVEELAFEERRGQTQGLQDGPRASPDPQERSRP